MARRTRPLGPLIATIVVMTVAVGGIVLPWLLPDRSTADQSAEAAQPAGAIPAAAPTTAAGGDVRRPSSTAGSAVVAAPASATWGVPVGYPQSPAGVRAAAVTWVASFGDLLALGPIARDDLLSELLSEDALVATVEEFRTERDRFANQFGRDVSQAVWADAPLTATIVTADDHRAVVDVWSVLLFGTTTDGVEMLWRTHEITLVWQRGAWRVDDVARRDGPTPLLATTAMPSTGAEFVDVVSWAPAVLAGTSVG